MKKTHTVRTFAAGFLAALLLAGTIPAAVAATASKNIPIYPGVSIYIDDQKIDPRDANGNAVEVFVYNGTTYLPVRAVSEALGKPVQWDGTTRSVYIGKHASDKPAAWLSQMDYFSGTEGSYFYTTASEQDNAGNTYYNCITRSFDRTYITNGQYTMINGTIYQKYDCRSYYLGSGGGTLEIYGDGELLYAKKYDGFATGIAPEAFHVDLTGVLQLRVRFTSSTNQNSSRGILSLGDVGLWT